jgi:hypothetical protein
MKVSGQLIAPAALSQEKSTGTHWIGGWVDPRAGLDAVIHLPGLEPPITQPVAQCHTTELAWLREVINTYSIWVLKHENKRLIGRHRHRWEKNIKVIFKELRCKDIDWMYLASGHCHMVCSCELCNEPLSSTKGEVFFWLVERLWASHVGLCSVKFVKMCKIRKPTRFKEVAAVQLQLLSVSSLVTDSQRRMDRQTDELSATRVASRWDVADRHSLLQGDRKKRAVVQTMLGGDKWCERLHKFIGKNRSHHL